MSVQNKSPFHAGEQAIQEKLGVRDKMERFGQQVIRDHMPDQHRDFFNQLPFVLVGHADEESWPWASLLFNEPGFVSSPGSKQLKINAVPIEGDPFWDSVDSNADSLRVGLLGIELPTRRRNRASGLVVGHGNDGLSINIEQSFGNCPQYIQSRDLEYIDPQHKRVSSIRKIKELDIDTKKLIESSDTFFVASYVSKESNRPTEGVDVSHRGGKPGFVRVNEDGSLTVPDYLGNFHFNTLGNFIENPKAGLLFIDFDSGSLLFLTGTVDIIWESDDLQYFQGAERLWEFHLDHGVIINNALPFRWKLDDYSPNTLLTGSWKEAEIAKRAEENRQVWESYEVVAIFDESSVIKSFVFKPIAGHKASFLSGQFATLKVNIDGNDYVRTYTVSSAPQDSEYRISIKRESSRQNAYPDGVVSTYLHQHLKVGDTIQLKVPQGGFHLSSNSDRPVVLLAGGVGITPMVSIARFAFFDGLRTRNTRDITLVSAAKNEVERAFFDEMKTINDQSHGMIRAYSVLSNPSDNLLIGRDYHHRGRISSAFLQTVLPIADYDFYICGPDGFMQSMYNLARGLGVNDDRIFSEAFGPSSLERDLTADKVVDSEPADNAVIHFTKSNVEQLWSKEDGTLLEFSESHGFTPEFSCRSGQCGACKTQLSAGSIHYDSAPTLAIDKNELLLCCAKPEKIEGSEIPHVYIDL